MSKKNRQEAAAVKAQPRQSRLEDYFWANLIFFGFLLLLAGTVYISCQAPGDDGAVKLILKDTFQFVLLLFGGGFLVVTLFDAAYDFFAEKAGADSQAPSAPEAK